MPRSFGSDRIWIHSNASVGKLLVNYPELFFSSAGDPHWFQRDHPGPALYLNADSDPSGNQPKCGSGSGLRSDFNENYTQSR
jgi:hypothetical protein